MNEKALAKQGNSLLELLKLPVDPKAVKMVVC